MAIHDTSTIGTETVKKIEIKWSTKYNDDDADVELVSSDGWHFKVHSYRLQTISPVFRSMISMATSSIQRDPITFTDDEFEVGVVIRSFLDGVYSSSMEDCTHDSKVNSTKYVIDFARKWECQGVLDMIELVVRLNIRGYKGIDTETFELLDLFLLAVKLEQYELAGDCLRDREGERWNDDEDEEDEEDECEDDPSLPANLQSDQEIEGWIEVGPVAGVSVFDLAASGYLEFIEIPPNIVWALMRANRLAKTNTNGEDFEDSLADEFVKLMRLGYPLTFSDPESMPKKRGRDEV